MTAKKKIRQKRQTWKDILRPFDEEYCKMLIAVDSKIKGMSRQDRERLSKALSRPSKTNCGWTMYAVTRHVKDSLSLQLASDALAAMGL